MPNDEVPLIPALAAGPSKFIVRSELMESYAAETVLSAGGLNLACTLNAAGEVQVFNVGYVSNGGYDGAVDIYNFFPDPRVVDGGWGVRRLYAPTSVDGYSLGRDRDGAIYVFYVSASDGHVRWTSDRPFDTWHDLGLPFGLWPATEVRVGHDADGELAVFVSTTVATSSSTRYGVVRALWKDPKNLGWDYATPFLSGVTLDDFVVGCSVAEDERVVGGLDSVTRAGAVALMHGDGDVQINLYDQRVQLLRYLLGTTSQYSSFGPMAALQTAPDQLALFAIFDDEIYYLPEVAARSGFTPQSLGQDLTFSALGVGLATFAGDDPRLQVFGIADGRLYYTWANPSPDGLPDWSTWEPLAGDFGQDNTLADDLTVCVDDQGASHVFGASVTGKLWHAWQSSDGEWSVEVIALPFDGAIYPVAVYATEVTVVDDDGASFPDVQLSVTISEYSHIEINGQPYECSPEIPVLCVTNAAGRITLTTPTGRLGTPGIRVDSSVLPDGAGLAIQPDAYCQSQIWVDDPDTFNANIENATYDNPNNAQTGSIWKDSDNQSGNVWPTDSADSADALSALYSSLSLYQPQDGDEQLTQAHVSRRGDRAGVRVVRGPGFGNRIDLAKVRPQHWWVRREPDGTVRFQILANRAEAMAVRDQLLAGTPDAELPSFSLPSISIPSWGELWHDVRDGVAAVNSILVSTLETVGEDIVSGIEATLSWAVNAISQAFIYVVDTLDKVFDMVQGIFEWIGTEFEQLFFWLGEILSWDDIKTGQAQIACYVNTMLGQLGTMLMSAENQLNAFLNQLIADIGTSGLTNPAYADVTISDTRTQIEDSAQSSAAALGQDGDAPGPSSNWAQNQVLNANGGTGPEPAPLKDGLATAVVSLISTVEGQLGGLLDDFINRLVNLFSTNDGPGGLTFGQIAAGLVEIVSTELIAALEVVLDAVFELIEDALALVVDSLNAAWDVPLLSKLYRDVFGTDMTLLNLGALLLAVPMSILLNLVSATLPAGSPPLTLNSLCGMAALASAQPGHRAAQVTGSSLIPDPSLGSSLLTLANGVVYVLYLISTKSNSWRWFVLLGTLGVTTSYPFGFLVNADNLASDANFIGWIVYAIEFICCDVLLDAHESESFVSHLLACVFGLVMTASWMVSFVSQCAENPHVEDTVAPAFFTYVANLAGTASTVLAPMQDIPKAIPFEDAPPVDWNGLYDIVARITNAMAAIVEGGIGLTGLFEYVHQGDQP